MDVIFVEDNRYDYELVLNSLKRIPDISLTYCVSYKDFSAIFQEGIYSLVISDYNLPDATGLEVFEFVRNIDVNIPFILCSGSLGEERAVSIMKLGVTDYVLKSNLTKLPLALERAMQERKQKESTLSALNRLKESELNYRSVVEDLTDFIVRYKENGDIIFMNKTLLNYLKISVFEPYKYNYFEVLRDTKVDLKKLILSSLNKYNPTLKSVDEFNNNGELKWQEWTDRVLINADGKIYAYQAVGRDITDIKRKELEIKYNNKKLQELTNNLQIVREDERAKIARDLHDDLGQQLAVLKMNASSLIFNKNFQFDESKVADFILNIDEAVSSLRRITSELRPPMLDDLGLFATLDWLVRNFSNKSNIACRIENKCEDQTFDKQLATEVFRIVQESLTNIYKHSRATEVNVYIKSVENGEFEIEIVDNGIGFDVSSVNKEATNGFTGMKERAENIDADLEIISEKDKGTRIYLKF